MAGQSVRNPFPLFSDNNGELLESGYIYIGEAGLNPETNPINIFWDKDLLYPAAQPIRTINGLPSRNGTATPLYTASLEYSLMVKNKNQAFVYSTLNYSAAAIPADNSITVAMYTAAAYPVLLVDAQTIAGPKTFTDPLIISADAPILRIVETDAPANNQKWDIIAGAGRLRVRVLNDAEDVKVEAFTIDRTGTTVDLFNILSTDLQHNGVKVPTISSTDTFSNKTFSDAIIASGGIQTDDSNTLKTKVIDIGDWDMDGGGLLIVPHGLTQQDIISVTGYVRKDSWAQQNYPMTPGSISTPAEVELYITYWDNSDVRIQRKASGIFDNVNFDKIAETIDNAAAVDKGSGLVGIPITGHAFAAKDTTTISGTTNYDDTYTIVSRTTNEIVIAATYTAETFAGTETATWSRGRITITYMA